MKKAEVDSELQDFIDAGEGASEPKEESAPTLSAKEELKQTLENLGSRPVVMPVIIAINLAVFAWMLVSGVSAMTPQTIEIVDWGGNIAGLTLSGDWWRLGTSMFVHIGILHIAMNMIVLWDGGRIVEKMIGHWAFLAMYLTSGLVGSVVSLLWNDNVVSAGASGAVFGVFGCLLALLIRDCELLPKSVRNRLAKGAVFFMGYNFLFGLGAEGIDLGAHVGGFLAGIVCGFIVDLGVNRERPGTRSALVAGLGVIAVVFALTAVPKPNRGHFLDRRHVVMSGANEVFYRDGASIQDAEKLVASLVESHYFGENNKVSVFVSKDEELYVVGLVLRSDTNPDGPGYLNNIRDMGGLISDSAFAGSKVQMVLMSPELKILKTLEPVDAVSHPPLEILTDGVWQIGYRKEATLDDATALKEHLVRVKFFQPDHPASVFLSKKDSAFIVGIVLVDPLLADNADVLADMPAFAAGISFRLAGAEVILQFLDTNKLLIKELPAASGPPAAE